MYIVFEGVVGTGKTTQAKRLTDYLKQKYPKREVIYTREPGGTEIAEVIRTLVQGTKFQEEMDPVCDAYLYAAQRAQLIRKLVSPTLKKGGIVVSDRSFLSSMAYQGGAQGLGIETVWEINKVAVQNTLPDIVLYMYLDIEIGLKRSFDKTGDKWESKKVGFFEKAHEGYLKISKDKRFSKNWVNVSANGSIKEVFQSIVQKVGI